MQFKTANPNDISQFMELIIINEHEKIKDLNYGNTY